MRIFGFGPVIDKGCRVLVLGSMPGVESLRKQEYYGHPQNKLWDVIYGIFKEKPPGDYELKKKFILEHKIALWDVIESCERIGSSDSKIKNVKLNDFESLFMKYPDIKHVYFNGRTSEKLFMKNFSFPEIRTTYLGSTSPAHALPLEKRLKDWSKILL